MSLEPTPPDDSAAAAPSASTTPWPKIFEDDDDDVVLPAPEWFMPPPLAGRSRPAASDGAAISPVGEEQPPMEAAATASSAGGGPTANDDDGVPPAPRVRRAEPRMEPSPLATSAAPERDHERQQAVRARFAAAYDELSPSARSQALPGAAAEPFAEPFVKPFAKTRTRSGALLTPARGARVLPIAVAVLLLAALGGLVWAFALRQQLGGAEAKLMRAMHERSAVEQQLQEADARIRANSVNMDQQSTQAQRAQAASAEKTEAPGSRREAGTNRPVGTEAATRRKLGTDTRAGRAEAGSARNNAGSVKTEAASTKANMAGTRPLLAGTRPLLGRAIGDAGVMSGLIARNHSEVEVLKHRGDRAYFEFTLRKNAPPTMVSAVRLQLKKTNQKKSLFTLVVGAEQRNIEKKDKTVNEPVQFYMGRNQKLYELVVNEVGKDVVVGYLSVPRGL